MRRLVHLHFGCADPTPEISTRSRSTPVCVCVLKYVAVARRPKCAHGARTVRPVSPLGRLRAVSVLLVDDDYGTLEAVATYLEHYGALVDRVTTGHAALNYLGTTRPDVIVVDYTMPGMSGVELLERIRKMDRPGQLPIPAILCTAIAGLRAVAHAAGFAGYMTKPFDPTALVDEIARLAGV